ncbi:MAG: hypothetical protein ACLT4C_04815 [Butyricicoccus sp.]
MPDRFERCPCSSRASAAGRRYPLLNAPEGTQTVAAADRRLC